MTVIFIPYTPKPYEFVTTLKGFIFLDENDQQTEEKVKQIVTDTLFPPEPNSEPAKRIRCLVALNWNNIPDLLNGIEDTIYYLCKSVVIHRLNLVRREDMGMGGGESHPAWNVYISPLSMDNGVLRDWRNYIRSVTFVTDANMASKTFKIFKCTICHAKDHPGGMCPYPSVKNWFAPMPQTSPILKSSTNPPTS